MSDPLRVLIVEDRPDDALLVATTCLKLDPYNGQVVGRRRLAVRVDHGHRDAGAERRLLAPLDRWTECPRGCSLGGTPYL